MSSTELGVPFVTPPGVPAGRLAALRKAFAETMTDPVFLRETAKQNLEVIPTAGADQAAQIEELYRVPKPIIERARVLMGG
jgi:tripartite-type tricarboxylate transporter receptor subunit TctC